MRLSNVLQDLRPYQEARKLVAMPSVLEWYSYVFASGNLLAGPFFELRDYRSGWQLLSRVMEVSQLSMLNLFEANTIPHHAPNSTTP